METLAYLYIVSEEAEQSPKQRQLVQMPVQEKKYLWQRRATAKTVTQSINRVTRLDCDRAHQPYPTFYL